MASFFIYVPKPASGRIDRLARAGAQVLEDPNPQALLDFGSSLAIAEDASSIVVGAGGRVMLNAISGGSDTAVDGRVGPSQGCCGVAGSPC